MAWSSADVTALENAIKSGILSVRYDGPPGRTVVYQSLQAMRDLLAEMRADVAAADDGRKSYGFLSVKKGFY